MTSQIRSRIEYLIRTDNILKLLLHSNLIKKSSLIDGFSILFNDNSEVAYFLLGHSVQVGFVMKVNLLLTIGTVRVFPMTYTMTENAIQVCR